MVRAKVSCLRAQQLPRQKRGPDLEEVGMHLALAERFLHGDRGPALMVMQGISGSGKSHLARLLIPETGAVRVRSDAERRRLDAATTDRYSSGARHSVYERLVGLATTVVRAGWPCIVDATFLRRDHRRRFRRLAEELGVPFVIVACTAPLPVLQRRVATRERVGLDPSEASAEVIELQLEELDPIGPDEVPDVMELDTSAELVPAQIGARLAERLGRDWH